MKKLLATILSLLMLTTVIVSVAEETPDVTSGWWQLNDASLNMKCFYHFNEDGTWYGYFFDGGVVQAGTYEIAEGVEYCVNAGPDGEYDTGDEEKAISDFAINCKTYDGKEFALAVAGDSMPDADLGGMSAHRRMDHKVDYNYVAKDEEIPLAVCTFYAENRVGNSLTLYHDHTYVEYASEMGDEGNWTTEDFVTYALESSWGGEASLAIHGIDAVYTTVDGEEIELKDSVVPEGEEIVNTFTAEGVEVGLPMSVDVRIECYGNGTAKLLVYVAPVDATLVADEGTYTVEEVYKYTFLFDKAGEIAGVPDFASATATGMNVTVPYAAAVEAEFMGNVAPMNIDVNLEGVASIQ